MINRKIFCKSGPWFLQWKGHFMRPSIKSGWVPRWMHLQTLRVAAMRPVAKLLWTLYAPHLRGHFGIAHSICPSVPWHSCLGCRHAVCLQLSHHQPPEMCRLRTHPQNFWIHGLTQIFVSRKSIGSSVSSRHCRGDTCVSFAVVFVTWQQLRCYLCRRLKCSAILWALWRWDWSRVVSGRMLALHLRCRKWTSLSLSCFAVICLQKLTAFDVS